MRVKTRSCYRQNANIFIYLISSILSTGRGRGGPRGDRGGPRGRGFGGRGRGFSRGRGRGRSR